MEETGGVVSELHYLAQYEVDGKRETIVKNVYHAQIKRLEKQPSYYETAGPVLIDAFPKKLHSHADFSFIIKDDIVPRCLFQLKNKNKALRLYSGWPVVNVAYTGFIMYALRSC